MMKNELANEIHDWKGPPVLTLKMEEWGGIEGHW